MKGELIQPNFASPAAPNMLTPEQLSSRSGIPEKTLRRWRCEYGDGAHGIARKGPKWIKVTPGPRGRIRYPLAFVEQWEREKMEAA